MRRNRGTQLVVLLAALIVSVTTMSPLEQTRFEQQRAAAPHLSRNHSHALQSNTEAFLSAPAPLANIRFTHLSVADGLSHADVRAIAQDRQGFMWFGTWLGGLNRYDGYTFKAYKHDDRDDRSLGFDSIWALYVDRAGVLWVGTTAGVDRYDRDTDSFVHYRQADDPTSLPSFIEDKSGTLWVSSSRGLSRFDRTSNAFSTSRRSPNDPTSFGDTNLRSICWDARTGFLWVGTWHGGVSVVDRSTSLYTRYKNNPNDPASLSSDEVTHILQDQTGNLWLSTTRGLNRFDPKTHKFIRYLHDTKNPVSLSDNYVSMTYEDRAGRFWVATNNGLNLMDRASGTFTRYLHDPNDASSLSSNVINFGAMYADASGALWIGMRSTGIDRWAGVPERFTTYRHNCRDANCLSNNVVTALAIDSSGALWIGTEAGLDRFDGRTFTHYLADPNRPNGLSPGPQREVAQDSRGAIWTGTYGGGLDRLDGHRVKHFRHDSKNSDTPANNNITSVVPDSTGGLWIGVHGSGLDYFDGRHFTHFRAVPGDRAGLPDADVVPLLLDHRGMLWMASGHWGLVRLDTHTRKFTSYLIDSKHPGSQAVNWTEDAYSDGASIWVVSPTRGLFRFDPDTGKFTHHYTEKDGLVSNTALGVLGDAQGNVWVGTANGLSRFDPKTEIFRNYDMFDGLQGNGFSLHCHATAPDGRVFFGGTNGLSAFYPDKLADKNPNPPPVVLTEFELFNEPVKVGGNNSPLRQAINVSSSITLRYDQSVFRFQFAALDFTAPQKNRYAYKLEGFDRDWQYTDATRRLAKYTHLDPGNYTFRVKASNNDGVWNEQGVALRLAIVPPWWNTNWFRTLCAAVFIGLLSLVHHVRVGQLARDFNLRVEARVNERSRIARELHDTLLQSFQASLVQMQVARTLVTRRPEQAVAPLDQAISMTEGAITEGRDAIRELRSETPVPTDLAKWLTLIGRELASTQNREGNQLAQFRATVEGEQRKMKPLIQDEAYRIGRELLRNAFQHAEASEVEAAIRYEDRLFRLRVRDNGKGIDPKILKAGSRTGHWGLLGMRERAKRIGGHLDIWSQTGAGTEVELSIPGATAYEAARDGHRPFALFHRKRAQS